MQGWAQACETSDLLKHQTVADIRYFEHQYNKQWANRQTHVQHANSMLSTDQESALISGLVPVKCIYSRNLYSGNIYFLISQVWRYSSKP